MNLSSKPAPPPVLRELPLAGARRCHCGGVLRPVALRYLETKRPWKTRPAGVSVTFACDGCQHRIELPELKSVVAVACLFPIATAGLLAHLGWAFVPEVHGLSADGLSHLSGQW